MSRAAGASESLEEPASEEEPLHHRRGVIRRGGVLDDVNHHPSVVKLVVSQTAARSLELEGGCSGVLIAPRLVLTAGHCVCGRRKVTAPPRAAAPARSTRGISRAETLQGTRVTSAIDASRCLERVDIQTRTYIKPDPTSEIAALEQRYRGKIIVHPRLEILYNQASQMVWCDADLAAVILDHPLNQIPTMRLPTEEVRLGQFVFMSGYGPGDTFEDYGERHVGVNKVGSLRRLDSGGIEFVTTLQRMPDGRAASHVEEGDSGGGCWIQEKDEGAVLVGITSAKAEGRNGTVVSVFTSVHAYMPWLREQLSGL